MNSELVESWMAEQKVSRDELAKRLGINQATLWRIMTAKTVRRTSILAMSAVTGIAVESLCVSTSPADRRSKSKLA